MKKVGYLGPPGTFTEAAARKYAGGRPVELVCCQSLPQIVTSVEKGQLDEGVVPLENSIEGAVNQILDLVAQTPGIKFCGEVILNIRHSLLVRPGIDRASIKKVMSHPQALAQCREYLASHLPGIETADTSSTAQAASIVAGSAEPWAAIGNDLAARDYGLEIVAADIQDSSDNATRFIVLSVDDACPGPRCRTSIIVIAKDRPGSLYGILREFALREINLTRIESRPVKKRLGQYMFFIDMEGHREDPMVYEALMAISGKADYLRVLGSYPLDLSVPRAGEDSSPDPVTLQEARAEIDLVDSQIVDLIGIRTRLVDKIGALKKDPERVRDAGREEEVIRRVRSVAAAKGADPEMIEKIYRIMISSYVKMQKKKIRKRLYINIKNKIKTETGL
ncbi:MAG: prephenate dehydratase [Bacillota bacterium]